MDKPSCFLALPYYGQAQPQALFSVMACGQKLAVLPVGHKMSDIDSNYTSLLCMALNSDQKFDYFAMLHSDVEPEPGWLDTLYDELQASGADILSAVIPIKNRNGITSTGLGRRDSRKVKRLTMAEVFDLPATFNDGSIKDVLSHPKVNYLAVNTGCMLWKRTQPKNWWRDFARQGGFHHEHWVEEDADGKLRSWMFPEDWNMSRWAAGKGLMVCATRKVWVNHHGEMPFANGSVWGEWKSDQDFRGY
jgi:hypothetical protein